MTEKAILDGDEQSHAVLWSGLTAAIHMVAERSKCSGISTAVGMLCAMRAMLFEVDEKAARDLFRALAAGQMGNEADDAKARRAAHKLYKAADALAEREGAQIQ